MMIFRHPKYYAELRKLRRKQQAVDLKINLKRVRKQYTSDKHQATSSQASSAQAPNQRTRVQASSQSQQAPGSDDQGTSAQAHGPGCKRQE